MFEDGNDAKGFGLYLSRLEKTNNRQYPNYLIGWVSSIGIIWKGRQLVQKDSINKRKALVRNRGSFKFYNKRKNQIQPC